LKGQGKSCSKKKTFEQPKQQKKGEEGGKGKVSTVLTSFRKKKKEKVQRKRRDAFGQEKEEKGRQCLFTEESTGQ